MQGSIVKADFQKEQGQHIGAPEIPTDALAISESLGVRTLRKMITDRIEDLNRFLQEA